jgi:hypothetical protein
MSGAHPASFLVELRGLFPWLQCEVDHTSAFAKVRIVWSLTFTPPVCFHMLCTTLVLYARVSSEAFCTEILKSIYGRKSVPNFSWI